MINASFLTDNLNQYTLDLDLFYLNL
jgi:hypothetical protein